ncbi:metal-dependent hydrolase [Natrialbaceae archaeon AArc-T1-2]|uniref:metal-dependent hydrolase n=1 Tax=Natrialbaceae archaeon AArc-T1-2 TaxID=3053904 RepID=UPI00255B2A09|nr:metal-dependent hydrolase [Natrialbaceae archaeon AArc-T1-2]WIV66333.1 metal-dependent hydrolase [Natrialbaceae archaeon AArc-T1-2]
MPSTVVHVALAGLMGAALLGEEFDTRAILVVMAATAIIDLDTLIGIYVPGTHRAALHNVWVVLIPGTFLLWDVTLRDESYVLRRWGAYGYRVAWVTLVTVLVAHILLDAFYNGVNLFWPLHDRFYDLSGKLAVTDQRGLVQTFVELEAGDDGATVADSTVRGTTEDTHYSTGFDPTRGETPGDVERTFPIASSGELFVVTIAGYATVAYRIFEERRRD